MSLDAATTLARAAEVYLAVGLCFALWFAGFGAARLDPVARGGTIGFRVLIVPGAALLWPWLALRLLRGRTAA